MKKSIYKVMIFMVIFLLAGCSRKIKNSLEFSFDENGKYVGFDTIRENVNSEEAVKNGYFIEDKYWNNFLKQWLMVKIQV